MYNNSFNSHSLPDEKLRLRDSKSLAQGYTVSKWHVPCVLSRVRLFVTPWTVCYLPGFSVHGILQARILEWVAISYSRGSSQPGNWTYTSYVSFIGRRILYHWATWVNGTAGHQQVVWPLPASLRLQPWCPPSTSGLRHPGLQQPPLNLLARLISTLVYLGLLVVQANKFSFVCLSSLELDFKSLKHKEF